VITRLGIDVLGEEKTSSESSIGPLSFREVVSSFRDSEAGSKTVPNTLTDYLLTTGTGTAPNPIDLILIQADHDFEVKVGSAGTYIECMKMDTNLAHAYFLATPNGVDGIYVKTGAYDTKFKWWEARKEP